MKQLFVPPGMLFVEHILSPFNNHQLVNLILQILLDEKQEAINSQLLVSNSQSGNLGSLIGKCDNNIQMRKDE